MNESEYADLGDGPVPELSAGWRLGHGDRHRTLPLAHGEMVPLLPVDYLARKGNAVSGADWFCFLKGCPNYAFNHNDMSGGDVKIWECKKNRRVEEKECGR